MPRYKEYNEIRVVEKAMFKFWSDGFCASSLKDLTQIMRINKFTFYEAFESKEQLLLRTMLHYLDRYSLPKLQQLRSQKNIPEFLLSFLKPVKKNFYGCYILTITAETGRSIPGAVDILDEYVTKTEKVLDEIVRFHHPDKEEKDRGIKVNQLMALFTSIPLIRPIHSESECINYIQTVLSRLNLNQIPDHAQESKN